MPRRVNQVEQERLTLVHVFHLDGMTLDGDSPFLFQIHVVKHLVLSDGQGVGVFKQSVSQRALAVVYVRDDAKVA